MQSTLLKVIAGIIAVGVLLIGLLAVALPRLINSDEFKTTLRDSAEDALGTPVEWQSLDAGLLPLRLTIRAPVLVAASGDPENARLTAESVELRLALMPIFARRIQVDSLVFHGLELVVTRTPEGVLLPLAAGEDADAASPDGPAVDAQTAQGKAFDLALRRITVSKGRILVRDRTHPRPIEWRLEDLRFEARGGATKEPLTIELDARIHSGSTEVGRIQTAGTVSLGGDYDLDIEIERLLLAELEPYLSGESVVGTLSGRVSLAGTTSSLTGVDLDLRIEELAVRAAGIDLAGELEFRASRALDDPATFSANLDLADGGRTEIVGTLTLDGDGPIGFDAGLEFSGGGRLRIEGTSTREGVLDVHAEIESFDLEMAKSFLPDAVSELAGLATGKAHVVGEATSPESISLDVAVEGGLLRMQEYLVEGPFLADLTVKQPLTDRPRGRVDLDLTRARLEYQDQFKKPAGMRAEMTTTFMPKESGEIVFESRIKFRDINEILLQGAIGDSTSVALTSSSFNLEGWADVFPALEPYQLDGIVRFEGVRFTRLANAPSRFGGRIEFDDVGVGVPAAGRLKIRGTIMGEGAGLRTKGLRVVMGGLTVGFDGKVVEPLNEARFELDVKSIGTAEANDLFSALTTIRDTVYGSLRFSGELRGAASSKDDFYSSLEGNFEFSIGEDKGGRLRGVSILRTVLDQIPFLGGAARLTQPFRGGRSVDDYFTDYFEVIEGDFEIGRGRANARTLRLVYEGYEANLSGPIRLRDLTIDMTGEVLLKSDLITVLGGSDEKNKADRRPIRIPLASVTNTLAEPKIVMTSETLAALPKLLFQGTGFDTLAIGLGKALGRFLEGSDD